MSISPNWLRGVQISLGIITVILSIYALAFPAVTFVAIIVLLAIILFIVGIEMIISGMFLSAKGRWTTIGLGVVILIFAGLAISFPVATAFIVTIFVGIGLIFNGAARIVDGVSGKHNGWAKYFLIGVGILSIIIGAIVLSSPLLGAVFAGIIIAIGLLITGIQMIAVGASGRRMMSNST